MQIFYTHLQQIIFGFVCNVWNETYLEVIVWNSRQFKNFPNLEQHESCQLCQSSLFQNLVRRPKRFIGDSRNVYKDNPPSQQNS